VKEVVSAVAKSQEHLTRLWMPIVEATFRQVRNATPERERVTEVARRLASGTVTLDEVTIVLAVEEAGSLSPDTAVIALYKRLLGRDPSSEDVERHSQGIGAGGVESLARAIVGSAEYRERFGRNGVPAQGPSVYERPVRTLFRELLNRDVDAESMARSIPVAAQSGFGPCRSDPQLDRVSARVRLTGRSGAPEGSTRYCGVP
jgi:hypothetical protein